MEPLPLAHYALYLAMAVLAWFAARRERSHRWVAAYIVWMAGSDLVRLALSVAREGSSRPFSGFARVALHADELIFLSTSFLFVALCTHYFVRRTPAAALGAFVATFGICLNYPLVSHEVLAWVYRAVLAGSLFAAWGCILWGMLRRRDLQPGLPHLVLIFYATTDVALNLVPFAHGFVARWPLVLIANFLLLVSGIAAHVVFLARRRAPAAA